MDLSRLLAQTSVPLGGAGSLQGLGPLGGQDPATGLFSAITSLYAIGYFERVISVTIGVMTVSAGIWFIFQLFTGAIQWLTAGSEKQALQNATKRITNAIVGLVLVVMAYGLIFLVGKILGIDIIDLQLLINKFLHP